MLNFAQQASCFIHFGFLYLITFQRIERIDVLNVCTGSQSRGRQSDKDSCGSIHQEQLLIPCSSGSKLKDLGLFNGSPKIQVPSTEEAEVESPPKELPPLSVTANPNGCDVLSVGAYLHNQRRLHLSDLEGLFNRTSFSEYLVAYGLTLVHVHSFHWLVMRFVVFKL